MLQVDAIVVVGMADEDLQSWVDLVQDPDSSMQLANELGSATVKILGKLCAQLGIANGRTKQEQVDGIMLHHWKHVIATSRQVDQLQAKLQALSVKGSVSLRSLLVAAGHQRTHKLSKEAMIDLLSMGVQNVESGPARSLSVGDRNLEGDAAQDTERPSGEEVSMVKTWLVEETPPELMRRLQNLSKKCLQDVWHDLGINQSAKVNRPKLISVVMQYQDDYRLGLPWVKKPLLDLITSIKEFQEANDGKMPKRTHRRGDGNLEEDKLAQRWRSLMNKKRSLNPKTALSATEIEYVEMVFGADVWDEKKNLEEYVAGLCGE